MSERLRFLPSSHWPRAGFRNIAGALLRPFAPFAPAAPAAPAEPSPVGQNPFWHYQCAFDAAAVMRQFADPDPRPSPTHLTNYLGVRIDPAFFPDILRGRENTIEAMPLPNNWHADMAEFGAALRAVQLAGDHFTAVELGCGWACWLNNTGVAARRSGRRVRLIGVEGDAGHAAFAERSLADNGFAAAEVEIIRGIAGARAGEALFPLQDAQGGAWGLKPVFDPTPQEMEAAVAAGTHHRLAVTGLGDIIARHGPLDLLHIDIQGGEADFVEACIGLCNESVRYLVIGTHSRLIEGRLETLLYREGWVMEVDRPSITSLENGVPTLRIDGVQGWRNPRRA